MAAAATAKPLVQIALAALLHHQLQTEATAKPPGNQSRARLGGRIQWAGRTFNSPAELVAWINSQGGHTNVGQFLGRHEGVAKQYGQRGVRPGGGLRAGQPGAGAGGVDRVLPGLLGPPLPATAPLPDPGLLGPPAPAGSMAGYPTSGLLDESPLLATLRRLLAGRGRRQPAY